MRLAILDIDGTLVDTNYQHTIAWARAFARHDVVVPLWQIHRHIGMGGDHLIAAVAGEQIEAEAGDVIRDAEKEHYAALIDEAVPFARARELLAELKDRGHQVVLASSADADDTGRYLDLLDAREVADAWTTSSDVESTKPAPDLVHAALGRVGAEPRDAVMIGDATWDVRSAGEAGVETIAVITGGFSEQELRDAGAVAVYESVAALLDNLDDTRLA